MKIAKVLGTKELLEYLEKYDLTLDSHFDGILGRYARKPWQSYVNAKNRHLVTPEAIDLLNLMLQYDHQKRPTCIEAMQHPYFEQVLLPRTHAHAHTCASCDATEGGSG